MGKKEMDTRFAKFGTVSFTSTSKVNDFADFLEKGKIMGTRCLKCGRSYFPPRADCSECLSSTIDWFEITGPGKLLTWSLMQFGPVGFEDDLPYSIAVVEFDEVKVFGRLAPDLSEDEVQVGMAMDVQTNELPSGQLNYVFVKR
ncbi:MAG: Zn-ribbon domain-containing OB-fold protein [Desulfohalobiaceae bacterium]|nr:Zn-ribbon domain-containing OB-fold protein [Desulfohalobiaceae bacterium]